MTKIVEAIDVPTEPEYELVRIPLSILNFHLHFMCRTIDGNSKISKLRFRNRHCAISPIALSSIVNLKGAIVLAASTIEYRLAERQGYFFFSDSIRLNNMLIISN